MEAVHFTEETDHVDGNTSGFGAAIDLFSEAAGDGLLVIVHQEDFMHNRCGVVDGDTLEAVGDGGGHEVAMFSFTTYDEAQGDDGVCFGKAEDLFHGDRNFKGSRHAIDGNAGVAVIEDLDLCHPAAFAVGHFDLIVLGSKGRSALKDLVIGSVAMRVSAVATTPVVLVK